MVAQKTRCTLIATLMAAVALPLGANATADQARRSSGTLHVNSTLGAGYIFGLQFCPPGTPSTANDCVRFKGTDGIPGLGLATVTYVKTFDEAICPGQVTQQKTTVIDVAGKGQITVAMDYPVCSPLAPSSVVIRGTIAGGTGKFTGASGNIQNASSVDAPACSSGGCHGSASDTWTGTLDVPGLEFDLIPPVLQGVASKIVKAPKRAKTVRVRYSLKAKDVVDGPVPVKCMPRSGSLFKVGRTAKVTCSAKDTSANVATRTFKVTVKKRRR